MSTDMFSHLQYGTASIFGKNLDLPPSRIVPLSLKEISEPVDDVEVFHYLTPHQEDEFVICKPEALLFEPAAYFQPPHTFLQSILYLTSSEFHTVVSQPKKRDQYLNRFLKNCLSKYVENTGSITNKKAVKARMLMQHVLGEEDHDTDPRKNPYFATMCKAALPENISVVVVHSNEEGNFRGTTPQKLPNLQVNLRKDEIKRKYLILLQLPNGNYAPYGTSFTQ